MDSEKYSLRQRQKRRQILSRSRECQDYGSDNSTESMPMAGAVRSHSVGKAKTKAAPLSKYRRKTANARERTRMREINSAFELLRYCVPTCIATEDAGCGNEKLTKITTLRMAMKYIRILSDALTNPQDADLALIYDCAHSKPKQPSVLIGSDACDAVPSEAKQPNTKCHRTAPAKSQATRKTTPAKRQSKRAKPDAHPYKDCSPTSALCRTSPASNASSAYASLSSSDSSASPLSSSSYGVETPAPGRTSLHRSGVQQSMSDLSNLMLESDGESQHISERCLSPLQPYTSHHLSGLDASSPNPVVPCLENPLELSLRLMDSPADSLHIPPVPLAPPSSCFSPLLSLDAFHTFDLFQSDFNDQATLDIFLA